MLGFTAYADTYLRFTYSDQTDETLPAHGDWVVEAINQTLDEPNKTEILCIDLDTLNSLGHFGKILIKSITQWMEQLILGQILIK